MKILIAPDKFKGSLSAMEVCQAISRGLKKGGMSVETIFHPMADGGDGSLEVLSGHLSLTARVVDTVDPLGRKISARYFTSDKAAFIEVASASGIVLLSETERNPLLTSTFGTGLMIRDAMSKGFRQLFLFLGGSSTNDAGIGIASALGWQFLDKDKNVLKPIGKNLSLVRFFEKEPTVDLPEIQMTLLCDVDNPLYGPNGAAKVYASQKGATVHQIEYLNEGLEHFSTIIKKQTGITVSQLPGSGAAGGIGASLVSLFSAQLKSGFTTLSDLTGLEDQIKSADLVITGEGKLDDQSFQGKVVGGVANLCRKHGKPLVFIAGKNELTENQTTALGVLYVFTISEKAKGLEDAMLNAANYLEEMGRQFLSLI